MGGDGGRWANEKGNRWGKREGDLGTCVRKRAGDAKRSVAQRSFREVRPARGVMDREDRMQVRSEVCVGALRTGPC